MKNFLVALACYLLLLPSASSAFAESYFYWHVGEKFREGPDKYRARGLDDVTSWPVVLEDDDWTCNIGAPRGFKDGFSRAINGKQVPIPGAWQEGVDITCRLKSDSRIGVTRYVACNNVSPDDNSEAAEVSLLNRKGTHDVYLQCRLRSFRGCNNYGCGM